MGYRVNIMAAVRRPPGSVPIEDRDLLSSAANSCKPLGWYSSPSPPHFRCCPGFENAAQTTNPTSAKMPIPKRRRNENSLTWDEVNQPD